MDKSLLDSAVQEFIMSHLDIPISKLALQKNPFPDISWIAIVNQIEIKKKSKEKLPTWFEVKNILFPSKISFEQTSSETTAAYKSSIVNGFNLIDLTGGFGIDDYYFAKKMTTVTHCEIESNLSKIVKHNAEQLGIPNCSFYEGDSTEALKELNINWDWIYIDPSRRNATMERVFLLSDCTPNVHVNLDFYFSYSNNILIKTAPLLDISAGLAELKQVKEIHIVALENEVKEILWVLDKLHTGRIKIKTIHFQKKGNQLFDFFLDNQPELPSYSLPDQYLYEPNSAIMKSGGFDEIAIAFQLHKLHKHSHIYTSQIKKPFPGRVFEIKKVFPYRKLEMKTFLYETKANISTRNFPETVAAIRKKWKISEGGDTYCFFTTDCNNDKIVLICNKTETS